MDKPPPKPNQALCSPNIALLPLSPFQSVSSLRSEATSSGLITESTRMEDGQCLDRCTVTGHWVECHAHHGGAGVDFPTREAVSVKNWRTVQKRKPKPFLCPCISERLLTKYFFPRDGLSFPSSNWSSLLVASISGLFSCFWSAQRIFPSSFFLFGKLYSTLFS